MAHIIDFEKLGFETLGDWNKLAEAEKDSLLTMPMSFPEITEEDKKTLRKDYLEVRKESNQALKVAREVALGTSYRIAMTDIKHLLPRNGTTLVRPVSVIKGIAIHHDAEFRPGIYNSLARYVSQARYHIRKDWGGGARGDGIQYHYKIDNVGERFICRELTNMLWAVGAKNYNYLHICLDGTTGQIALPKMKASLKLLLDELSYNHSEFPAGRENVRGHGEVPGNNTACPGSFLTAARQYRANQPIT